MSSARCCPKGQVERRAEACAGGNERGEFDESLTMFAPVRYVGPMHSFKMILGGALVAGSLTGCVINTGGTDTNLTSFTTDSNTNSNTDTDATAGTDTTEGTSTATGTETEGTGTATEGTEGTTAAPTTTTAPTTGEPTSTTTTEGTTGGGLCGWSADDGYYTCNFEGEDPGGTNPIECPENLVAGDPCSDSGLTGQGCCDASGNNWYCGEDMGMQIVVLNECS